MSLCVLWLRLKQGVYTIGSIFWLGRKWRTKMKNYRKKNVQPMEPWTHETDMALVSVSESDKTAGSPKAGDMIAVNPNDATDKWLVAKKFFEDNYEPA